MGTRRTVALMVCVITMLSACSMKPKADSFQLVIYNDSWLDLRLGYTPENAFPVLLNNMDTRDSLFVIGLHEIEEYDWDTQTIILTEEATSAFIASLENATHGEERAVTNMLEELNWGNSIEWELYLKSFVVKVDGSPLYGGIFLQPYSQMAITFPVIRISMPEGKATMSLAPIQPPFSWDTYGDGTTYNSSVNKMVDLIRDKRIRALLDAEGKLK